MFCKFCGKQIEDDCVVCPKCGKQVADLKLNDNGQNQPIIINNNNNNDNTNDKKLINKKTNKKYNFLIDLFMICITGGLWIIWMLIRPKY